MSDNADAPEPTVKTPLDLDEVEEPTKHRPYQTIPRAMGRQGGYNVDNVQELLARAEGEACR
jgi:hypothetical protein